MTCLHCDRPALEDMVVCLGCLPRAGEVATRAAAYAVACVLYYGESGRQLMGDARFDGLRSWLLQEQAWKAVPWLSKSMLMPAARHDLGRYPARFHRMARQWLAARRDTDGPRVPQCG